MRTHVGKLACLGGLAAVGMTIGAQLAIAQDFRNLSCGQLWYERNAIFAQYGYCFKTEQAINAFGRGCVPPYGRLPGHAQSTVNDIIFWERRKGC